LAVLRDWDENRLVRQFCRERNWAGAQRLARVACGEGESPMEGASNPGPSHKPEPPLAWRFWFIALGLAREPLGSTRIARSDPEQRLVDVGPEGRSTEGYGAGKYRIILVLQPFSGWYKQKVVNIQLKILVVANTQISCVRAKKRL